ncbi:hypothetical protein [Leptolyngbya phage Lbo-JY46]
MEATISRGPVRVSWAYDNRIAPEVTTCIVKNPAGEILAEATVKKHPKTVSCKKEARRYSLKAVIAQMGLPKEDSHTLRYALRTLKQKDKEALSPFNGS